MYAFPKEVDSADPVITSVAPNSPAASAGLEAGDKIMRIGGKQDPNWQDVMTVESLNANRALPVVVERHGKQLTYSVTPRMDPREGIGVVGWNGEEDVQIGQVLKDSPAAAAGLQPGDLLLSVNDQPIVTPVVLQQAVIHSAGKPVSIKIMRENRVQTISVTPTATNEPKLPWHIGIGFRYRVQIVKLGFGPAIVESLRFNSQNATMIFRVLGSIVERRVSPKALAGPIGIAQMSSEAAQQGPLSSAADVGCEPESCYFQPVAYSDPRRGHAAAVDYRDAAAAGGQLTSQRDGVQAGICVSDDDCRVRDL
jgi:regulator of sigma E protease